MQQHASRLLGIGCQPQAAVDLLGARQIVFQRLGHGFTLDADDTLVTLPFFLWVDGDDKFSLSDKFREWHRRQFAVPLRHATQGAFAGGFHDQQVDRSVALDLQDHGAIELEHRGEQHRRGHEFAEQVAHSGRIFVTFEDSAPGTIQVHNLAADCGMLKDKPLQGVAGFHHDIMP